ncbi:ribonuclease D [Bartonella sp. DGB2]|uniref:ribonuclease D n=1 Tax=Bartonella sp. DGB2 TaxID=3388426 RepID=UPI00398FAD2D
MTLITSTYELEAAIRTLRMSPFVTVDSEFIRETTFWPELCLIQLASADLAVLIDPKAKGLDLRAFFDLMADENIVKVFHAARQDIEIIHHLAGIIPAPLFDTQIAAAVCGYGEAISYDQIVQRLIGHRLDKSSRFTNWGQRPLSEKQMAYALADVTHLCDVYTNLKNELSERGREEWLLEEIAPLLSVDTYAPPIEDAWKRVKGRVKKPRELAILQQVAAWRERIAKERNLPRGRVLKDEVLIEIAIQQPKDGAALAQLRGLSQGFERSEGAHSLLEAIKEGFKTDLATLPPIQKFQPRSESLSAAIDLLRVLLKAVADEHHIAPKIIATTDDLEKIVKGEGLAEVPAMRSWRYSMFGEKAQKMLSGKIYFYFEGGKILIKEHCK